LTWPLKDGKPYDRYTAAELEALPTLCVGQADDLKIETAEYRVWLCRAGVADGMYAENVVTVEACFDGRWRTIATYAADGGPTVIG
jgi:hypothetical protein